jgi:cytochrome c oxidase cbb3-type subunit 3
MAPFLVLFCAWMSALALAQSPSTASPAAKPAPKTATPQTYSRQQIDLGAVRFASECGFCHGRDAAGGEGGSDLTRSMLVAKDVRGNAIAPVVRQGRTDKGMPAFSLKDADMAAIVAFIHDAKTKADSAGGGRRSVETEDLQTGNAAAGKEYFNGPGGCASCHVVREGSFATVGSRYKGLALLQRMLYPGSGRDAGPTPPASATITTTDGTTVTGKVAYRDEFTISITDADGWTRSWPVESVTIRSDNPLRAHIEQLAKYTDNDMHNVFAYLQTLQ